MTALADTAAAGEARKEPAHPSDGGAAAPLIRTFSLTKRYGRLVALDGCTLDVPTGEVFGLLGPNGSGKTTLLRLLMGFLKPTSGSAAIRGLDCHRQSVEVHRQTAYLPGDCRLFRMMRGRDVLRFFADVRAEGNFDRAAALAGRLELDLSRRVAFHSTGMRQKLALAAVLSLSVPLVILDEPTSNLDPTMRKRVLSLVREAKAAGRTVVFSSHVLSETEEVCDRVAILRAGKLVHQQWMGELRRQHVIRARLPGPMPAWPTELGPAVMEPMRDGEVKITTPGDLVPVLGFLATLPLEELRFEPVGLSAVYDRFHPPEER
jgi:ABC-2 type transport system ATP-binding protein